MFSQKICVRYTKKKGKGWRELIVRVLKVNIVGEELPEEGGKQPWSPWGEQEGTGGAAGTGQGFPGSPWGH